MRGVKFKGNTKCAVVGCEKTGNVAGRCMGHYRQGRSQVSLAKSVQRWSLSARIGWNTGPREVNGCRLWTGATWADGYPMIMVSGRRDRVSRAILGLQRRDGLVAMHLCDTPLCVEPSHLRVGTHAENVADRDAKGRHVAVRGEQHPAAKLTLAEVERIRAAHAEGESLDALAAKFHISPSHASRIVGRTRWADDDQPQSSALSQTGPGSTPSSRALSASSSRRGAA